MRINIYIIKKYQEIFEQAKRECRHYDISLSYIIARLLKKWLEDPECIDLGVKKNVEKSYLDDLLF